MCLAESIALATRARRETPQFGKLSGVRRRKQDVTRHGHSQPLTGGVAVFSKVLQFMLLLTFLTFIQAATLTVISPRDLLLQRRLEVEMACPLGADFIIESVPTTIGFAFSAGINHFQLSVCRPSWFIFEVPASLLVETCQGNLTLPSGDRLQFRYTTDIINLPREVCYIHKPEVISTTDPPEPFQLMTIDNPGGLSLQLLTSFSGRMDCQDNNQVVSIAKVSSTQPVYLAPGTNTLITVEQDFAQFEVAFETPTDVGYSCTYTYPVSTYTAVRLNVNSTRLFSTSYFAMIQ